MRRLRLAALGALCLLVSAWLAPVPSVDGASVTASIGRSMGGLRVVLINLLFLRAEALRSDGQDEEAAGLYATILELDPANDTAAAFLIDLYVQEFIGLAVTTDGRMAWWREAHALLRRGLELNPGSARLHLRAAQLLLDPPRKHPDLEPLIAAEEPRPRLRALQYLWSAARSTENLPTLGRFHLRLLAYLAPALAAEALVANDGEAYTEAMAAGRDLMRMRGRVLEVMIYPVQEEDGIAEHPLDRILAAGLRTVEGVREALARGQRASARALLERYAATVGSNDVVFALETLLAG